MQPIGRGSMGKYKLVICLDRKGKKGVILEKGTIDQIDKITTSFNNSKELRAFYIDQIEQFEEKYKTDIEYLKNKLKKEESGDITIIDEESKADIPRESIIYNQNIEMFELALKDNEFIQFLRNVDYSSYCSINRYNYEINETTSWLIRKIPKTYEEYRLKYNKLPLKTLYKHYLKEQQLMYKIYSEIEEKEEPTTLEAYEIEFMRDRNENQKYNIRETKQKQKTRRGK